ncbi:MAG: hypothetical protein ACRDP5_26525 [Streptosporangiaceae bacterium]
MAANQNNLGPGEQGGFLRVLGIIYLVKMIRQRRRERRQRAAAGQPDQG